MKNTLLQRCLLVFSTVGAPSFAQAQHVVTPLTDVRTQGVGVGVTASLATTDVRVAVGTPILFDLVIEAADVWDCIYSDPVWQRHSPDSGDWIPLEHKSLRQPRKIHVDAKRTWSGRLGANVGSVYRMSPGRWRTRFALCSGETVVFTNWCYVDITAHEPNRQIMSGERGLDLQRAWEFAVSNCELGDTPNIPPGGLGGTGSGDALESLARSLAGLRSAGASTELATRADLSVLARDVRRVQRTGDANSRLAAALAADSRIQKLLAECGPLATPLGGLHGELLELQVRLWKPIDAERATRISDGVRIAWPVLAARLE